MMPTSLSHPSLADSRARAEDDPSLTSRWSELCQGVLIPLGSILCIFLFMLGIMLMTD